MVVLEVEPPCILYFDHEFFILFYAGKIFSILGFVFSSSFTNYFTLLFVLNLIQLKGELKGNGEQNGVSYHFSTQDLKSD